METAKLLSGGCICGAIRFRVTRKPLSVHACHCTDCQTISGSAFGLSMVLEHSAVEVIAGSLEINKFSSQTTDMHRYHCGECGTAIFFSSPDFPGIVALKPGTLDDTSTLRPIAHMWYRSAQAWLKLGDGLPKYQEQPSFSELIELGKNSSGKLMGSE